MGYTKFNRNIQCPNCSAKLVATIQQAGYGPANEWESENCPKCGEKVISEKCLQIDVEIKQE